MSAWGQTPRQSVRLEVERRGHDAVVAGCLDLLARRTVDPHLIVALGGPPASWAVDGGDPGPDYWLRVWALRGLLHAWDDRAGKAVVHALGDDAWRVREMALKVVARHRVVAARRTVSRLASDDKARVRAAADRAAARLAESE